MFSFRSLFTMILVSLLVSGGCDCDGSKAKGPAKTGPAKTEPPSEPEGPSGGKMK